MTESELKKHLSSGSFKQLYLVFGEEKMLVKRCAELIEKKLTGGEISDFNYHTFDDATDIAGISVSADIIPFMSERNIVKLVDFNIDKMPAEDFKALMKVIEKLPASTVMLIVMPTLELTSKTAKAQMKKLIAYAEKNGVCIELSHRTGLALERDLCKWAKAGGCTMSELTAHQLIQYVGEDLNRLNTEMKKLTAYADGGEITPEMIALLVHKTTEASIYDLFGYIVAGDTDRVMQALSVLFYEQIGGMTICSVLANAYLDAYRARAGSQSGRRSAEVAADFGYRNRAWVLDKTLRQISRVTTGALRRSIDELVAVQTRLVTETVDERLEVERLACKLVLIAEDRSDE
jgi:DNA polymerase-3 subunit delta